MQGEALAVGTTEAVAAVVRGCGICGARPEQREEGEVLTGTASEAGVVVVNDGTGTTYAPAAWVVLGLEPIPMFFMRTRAGSDDDGGRDSMNAGVLRALACIEGDTSGSAVTPTLPGSPVTKGLTPGVLALEWGDAVPENPLVALCRSKPEGPATGLDDPPDRPSNVSGKPSA